MLRHQIIHVIANSPASIVTFGPNTLEPFSKCFLLVLLKDTIGFSDRSNTPTKAVR